MLLALLGSAYAASSSYGGLLINELVYRTDGGDGGREWVEICNASGSPIDLTGVQLQTASSSWSEAYTWTAGTINPGEHLLVGPNDGSLAATWPVEFSPNLYNGDSNTAGVRLTGPDGVSVIDTVLFSGPNDNGLLDDDENFGTAPASASGDNESLGRGSDCVDTNDSSVDFAVYTTPSPGEANPAPSVDTGGGNGGDDTGSTTADCSAGASVKLNEISYATDDEWAELYNTGGSAVDVGGWQIRIGTSGGEFSKSFDLPGGTSIAAGGYLLVATSGSTRTADVYTTSHMDMGNATSGQDSVQLACGGVGVDTIIYGTAGDSDIWYEDDGTACVTPAPKMLTGGSLARKQNGADTDRAGTDWWATDVGTPGEANPELVCQPGGAVRLNEFLYDPESTDTGMEWVELYNPGDTDLRLDGYGFQAGSSVNDDGSWSGDTYTFAAGTTIAAGAYMVVGGSGVSIAEYQWADSFSIGNGSDGDGLRLTDCAGGIVDTVLYGDDPMLDGLTGDDGTSDVVPGVTSNANVSLGRVENGVDTNTTADWTDFGSPSPGAANVVAVVDPGKTGGGGCGGGAGAPNAPSDPNTGCTTGLPAGAPFGATAFGLVLAALVRRRR